jgi:hypothetical protein
VIILPLGILLAIRLMPAQVLEDCQLKASEWEKNHVKRPANRFAAVIVVLVWLVSAGILGAYFLRA